MPEARIEQALHLMMAAGADRRVDQPQAEYVGRREPHWTVMKTMPTKTRQARGGSGALLSPPARYGFNALSTSPNRPTVLSIACLMPST